MMGSLLSLCSHGGPKMVTTTCLSSDRITSAVPSSTSDLRQDEIRRIVQVT